MCNSCFWNRHSLTKAAALMICISNLVLARVQSYSDACIELHQTAPACMHMHATGKTSRINIKHWSLTLYLQLGCTAYHTWLAGHASVMNELVISQTTLQLIYIMLKWHDTGIAMHACMYILNNLNCLLRICMPSVQMKPFIQLWFSLSDDFTRFVFIARVYS